MQPNKTSESKFDLSVTSNPALSGFLCFRVCCLLSGLILNGCLIRPSDPLATRPSTDIPAEQAEVSYWMNKPGNVTIGFGKRGTEQEFEQLLEACKASARARGFQIDREDFRSALVTSKPLTASQFFEPWLQDNVTSGGVLRSSIGTYRRTVYFEFSRETPAEGTIDQPQANHPKDGQIGTEVSVSGGGRFVVTPKVILERKTTRTGNVSTARVSLEAVSPTKMEGNREADAGQSIPITYWYATGRDENLERQLARDVLKRLY